jgi:polyhydroxyalkanoate synthesis repressor PhaR
MATRVLRKYANRRLYDTSESRHVTLDEVRDIVVAGGNIRVEDAKTGEDLTRSILLQIIVEREAQGKPLLSADLLQQLIRFYGGAMQDFLGAYLERSVSAFVAQQESLQEQMMKLVADNPITDLTKRNLALWQELGETMVRAMDPASQKDPDEKKRK